MSFSDIPTAPGVQADVLRLGAARLGVRIEHGHAVLALDDGVGCHRAACAVDREQLLAAGMLTDAAERLRVKTTTPLAGR